MLTSSPPCVTGTDTRRRGGSPGNRMDSNVVFPASAAASAVRLSGMSRLLIWGDWIVILPAGLKI